MEMSGNVQDNRGAAVINGKIRPITDNDIEEVRESLEYSGEDLQDYDEATIIRMIKRGFLDE